MAGNDEDLGLDDILTEEEEVVETEAEVADADEEDVSTQTAMVQKKAATPPASKSKELFNFDDLKAMPGVVVGDVGLEISRFAVERAKFTTAARSLISIVSSKVIAIKTHYNEDLGNFICFEGVCCEHEGLPKVRYLLPVVVYDTNKKGVPISKELSFKCLCVGKEAYDDIKTIMELNGDISKFDLVVTCKDEQYQKISLATAGEARWRKSKEMAQEVVNFWKQNMKELVKPVARLITEKDYLKQTEGSVAVEAPTGDDVDFDSLFDDNN